MKIESKAIIASAVVIVLCLAAVGGVTYSWFSDTEQAEVEITAGKIDLSIDLGDVTVSSYNGVPKVVNSGEETKTDLGGTATYTMAESSTDSSSSSAITAKLTNAAPGDKLVISITSITLKSTINTVYVESYTVLSNGIDVTGTADCPFIVTGFVSGSQQYAATGEQGSTIYDSVSGDAKAICIMMNEEAGNEFMGKTFTVTLTFSAYQSNAPVTGTNTTISQITSGTNSITVGSSDKESTAADSASVTFSGDGVSDKSVEVKNIENKSDVGYTVSTDAAFIGGIDVKYTDGTDSALNGIETTVSFVLGGDLTGTDVGLSFYHKGTQITIEDSDPGTTNYYAYKAIYDSSSDKTTISFKTTAGFSQYYITAANISAKTGVSFYKSLSDALANCNGGAVFLLRDVTLGEGDTCAERFIGTLYGNGHTVTMGSGFDSEAFAALFKYFGSNTVVKDLKYDPGEGIVRALTYGWNFGNLTFDNVDIVGNRAYECSSNNSAYINYFAGTTLTFIDCDNSVSYYSNDVQAYCGVFLGGYIYENATLKFIRCTNSGDMLMSNPGLYIGNTTNQNKNLKVIVQDCVNTGNIQGTVDASLIGSIGTPNAEALEAAIAGTTGSELVQVLNDESLALVKQSDGTMSVTAASNTDAVSYKISYTVWASCHSDGQYVGTSKTTVLLDVDSNSTSIAQYRMMDLTTYRSSYTTVIDENAWKNGDGVGELFDYYLDESNHIIVVKHGTFKISEYEVDTVTINTMPTPYISIYDESGKILATKVMTTA